MPLSSTGWRNHQSDRDGVFALNLPCQAAGFYWLAPNWRKFEFHKILGLCLCPALLVTWLVHNWLISFYVLNIKTLKVIISYYGESILVQPLAYSSRANNKHRPKVIWSRLHIHGYFFSTCIGFGFSFTHKKCFRMSISKLKKKKIIYVMFTRKQLKIYPVVTLNFTPVAVRK